jgi:hypothetical protein
MHGWNTLYEKPTVLTAEWGHQRIYAPHAYARIREATDAPIVLGEAAQLAQFYPICWRMEGESPILSVLRSLLPGGRGHYGGTPPLPLSLQAYPFIIPDARAIEQQQLLVDDSIADQPTDIGAPIILDSGRMSSGALTRARNALQIGRALPATSRLGQDLLQAGLLEPWPLKFDLGEGKSAERNDLMVLSASHLGNSAVFTLVSRHGAPAGVFLGLHRLSLFRISTLLQLAKAASQAGDQAGQGFSS